MCYYIEQKASVSEVINRFRIEIDNEDNFYRSDYIKGFDFPNVPIITNENPDLITTSYSWGLVSTWDKKLEFRNKTLNARIETIHEKPSYKNITENRCLIIATSFFEWRWLDSKGNKKEKYQIFNQEEEIFCFAGLYTKGVNPSNGDTLNTFTIVTTEANELMEFVHNNKKRMPVVLKKEDEKAWLDLSNNIDKFAFPYDASKVAFSLT